MTAAVSVGALDRPITVTVFCDFAATEQHPGQVSLRALVPHFRNKTADSKAALPWIKLARFGDKRTKSNSLRHNENLLAIDGIEADYDAEVLTVDEAEVVLRKHDLAGVIYTSPSHTEDKPRWRVMCPTSTEMAPTERAKYPDSQLR